MGCNCGGRTSATAKGTTLGFYVVLPDGSMSPEGVNPDDPSAGTPPYFSIVEAQREVTLNAGGTIRRLKRTTVA